jgi:hypothetical protein
MSEETKTQFPQEGDNNPFSGNNGNDNPSGSSPEKTDADQTPSSPEDKIETQKEIDSEKKPFNEDPRWQEREKDWRERYNEQERRHTEEINKLREEVEGKIGQKPPANNNADDGMPDEVPSWFGGDQEQWNEFRKWNGGLLERATKNIEDRIMQTRTEEQKRIDEATKYMDDTITSIEQNPDLNPSKQKIDRNKLYKSVLDNELVDTKGRWNYKAGFLLMRGAISPKPQENKQDRKEFANATKPEHKAEEKTPNFMTSDDFSKPSNRPW